MRVSKETMFDLEQKFSNLIKLLILQLILLFNYNILLSDKLHINFLIFYFQISFFIKKKCYIIMSIIQITHQISFQGKKIYTLLEKNYLKNNKKLALYYITLF